MIAWDRNKLSTAALILTTLLSSLSAFSSFFNCFFLSTVQKLCSCFSDSLPPPCFQTYKYISFVMLFPKSFASR